MKRSVLLLLICLFAEMTFSQKAAFIGYNDLESDSAFHFMKSVYPDAEKISALEVGENLRLLWIHIPDSTARMFDSDSIRIIKNYVNRGGNLLLTLDAFQLIYELGLEAAKPELRYITAVDEGYGRKLGIHSFISHPVFKNLNGGAYIWNAKEDNTTRIWGYFGDNLPAGKTVGVDWAYITLKEDSRIMLEYDYGKGKIIAIGAYTFYSRPNFNREQLDLFTKNCFEYLLTRKDNTDKFYWDYSQVSVNEIRLKKFKSMLNDSKQWTVPKSLNLKSNFASENYWDLAGERILIMGKEKGGIDEIWIHPFMALRDYEVGIKFSYKDTIYWLNEQRPKVEVSPAYLKRVYNFRRAFLTEIISADPRNPSGVIHYEYRGVFPGTLVIKFKSNLRFMWPYSEKAFREIEYLNDSTINYFLIRTGGSLLSSVIGINKNPAFKDAGRYDDFELRDTLFRGIPSDKMQVSGIMVVNLEMNDNLDVTISGSNISPEETINEYNKASANPGNILNRSAEYVNDFYTDKLSVITPDSNFNEGYKWALAGSDKFFVNTPGIGKSLVAGYSTTARGWDGGHKINGRPGYAWYFGRDAVWSGFALLDYGDFAKVKNILETFNKFQDVTGKIYHELTTSGAVHYDAADATPLYVILTGRYLRYSDDTVFIRNTWKSISKAIEYCYSTDTDGDHLIENTNVGHGWVEGGSLYGAHTTLYLAACWAEALKEASFIAGRLGLKEKDKFEKESGIVTAIINSDFWNRKDDFYYYGKLKDGTFNPEKTVLPSIPLLFGLAEKEKASRVLDDYASNNFSSDWGLRIMGMDRPGFNPSGYHTGSVWPLFTGWTALAEYQYGNYIQGYTHILNNMNVYKSFSKGYVEEVLNGSVYEPSGVCPHQCWSETMMLQPLIEGMLGIKINGTDNQLSLSPVFPADWDFAEVKNIRMHNCLVSYKMKKEKDYISYSFTSDGGELIVHFNPALPLKSEILKVVLNNKPAEYSVIPNSQNITLSADLKINKSAELKIYLKEGFSLLPVIPEPQEGDSSSAMRIISTSLDENLYTITVEGKPGTDNLLKFYSPLIRLESTDGRMEREGKFYTLNVSFNGTGNYLRRQIKVYHE